MRGAALGPTGIHVELDSIGKDMESAASVSDLESVLSRLGGFKARYSGRVCDVLTEDGSVSFDVDAEIGGLIDELRKAVAFASAGGPSSPAYKPVQAGAYGEIRSGRAGLAPVTAISNAEGARK